MTVPCILGPMPKSTPLLALLGIVAIANPVLAVGSVLLVVEGTFSMGVTTLIGTACDTTFLEGVNSNCFSASGFDLRTIRVTVREAAVPPAFVNICFYGQIDDVCTLATAPDEPVPVFPFTRHIAIASTGGQDVAWRATISTS